MSAVAILTDSFGERSRSQKGRFLSLRPAAGRMGTHCQERSAVYIQEFP